MNHATPTSVRYYARPLATRLTFTAYWLVLGTALWLGFDWLHLHDEVPMPTQQWLVGVLAIVTVILLGWIIYGFRYVDLTPVGLTFWPVAPWGFLGLFGARQLRWDDIVRWTVQSRTTDGVSERVLCVFLKSRSKPRQFNDQGDWFELVQRALLQHTHMTPATHEKPV